MHLKGRRAAALNLGCKVNHYETEAIKQELAAAGCKLVSFDEPADIYIINTCTVTGEAARKSRQMVRRAKRLNDEAVVIAMGCDVEQEREKIEADITVGNTGKAGLVDVLSEYFPGEDGRLDIASDMEARQAFEEMGAVVEQNETRATIKIQDGCDNFCSYCAIPYARGRVRSRDPGSAVQEAKRLAEAGYKELVITGIHICSYGAEWKKDGLHLMDLMDELAAIPGIQRIRLGSIEPNSVTEDFARRMGENPALCPHIHLSLQSGSAQILKLMRRRYDPDRYRLSVEHLRRYVPDILLTTDVIVGFPGENEAFHKESLAFCREIGFTKIHTFRYSPREGTLAARLPGRVGRAVAEKRSADFIRLSDEGFAEAARRAKGSVQAVLLEQQTEDGVWTGYTPGYMQVFVTTGNVPVHSGDIIDVEIGDLENGVLLAKTTQNMW